MRLTHHREQAPGIVGSQFAGKSKVLNGRKEGFELSKVVTVLFLQKVQLVHHLCETLLFY